MRVDMSELKTHSKEWFNEAFKGVDVPDYIKVVSAHICSIYNIRGICDPAHIANLINLYVTTKPTKCTKTATGEHFRHGTENYCQWCFEVFDKGESKNDRI